MKKSSFAASLVLSVPLALAVLACGNDTSARVRSNLKSSSTDAATTPSPYRKLVIPGTIQAEDFDNGGEGVSYHDSDPGNSGGSYRETDVDIGRAGDIYAVGWIDAGEWLRYTVNVAASGSYTIGARVASIYSDRSFVLELDGRALGQSFSVPNTGDWNRFQTAVQQGVHLSAGMHALRFRATSAYFNIDSFQFSLDGQDPAPVPSPSPRPSVSPSPKPSPSPSPSPIPIPETSTTTTSTSSTSTTTSTTRTTTSSTSTTTSSTTTTLPAPVPSGSANRIHLDPSIRYQTMTGWEATSQAGQEYPSFPLIKNTLFDLAASDLGINRMRLEFPCRIENTVDYWAQYHAGAITESQLESHSGDVVNDNADSGSINLGGFKFAEVDYAVDNVVLPMKQRVEARGEHLHINANYVCFRSPASYVHSNPAEYAEFVLAAYQHMSSKYGFVPDTWEMVLEPDNTLFWRGPNAIGDAVVATGQLLQSHGFRTSIVAPSTTNMANAAPMFDDLIKVPGALQWISELSYHRYAGATVANLQAIASRASQYGVKTAMLEMIGAGYDTLHQDLKIGQNSAWQQFTLSFPGGDNGGSYFPVDTTNPAAPKVVVGKQTKFLRQYFKFVRAGDVRIEASSNAGFADPVAFRKPSGKMVVVVKASSAGTFSIDGLAAGTYGIKYTTATAYDVDLADQVIVAGGVVTTSIPGAGAITIYGR